MSWGGVVDWTPDAKVRIAEATDEISRRLEVDDETANRLWEGMSDVYELMAIGWPVRKPLKLGESQVTRETIRRMTTSANSP